MAITIDWSTRIINVPRDYLTQISPTIYRMDIVGFKRDVSSILASEVGIVNPDAVSHNSAVTLGNVTLADVVQVINGYTVTFENGVYAVDITGANSNIGDVLNLNYVSVRSYNSAGLQIVAVGSGVTEQDKADIADRVWHYTRQ